MKKDQRARPHGMAPWAVAVLWAIALAYSSISGRVLYGDGAYYVLQNLASPHRFNDYDFQRTFASLISQAPVLFGQRLGFDSVAAYSALYAIGMFVVLAAAMVSALFLVRRQPFLFATLGLAIVVYGFGANFINTEANLLFGFVWLAVAILALPRPAPLLRGVALPALGIALLRSYEGMLLVGPVLTVWAVVALPRAALPQERVGLGIAGLLFLLGTVIGLGGFLSPRDPGNVLRFVSATIAYLRNPQGLLLASAAVAAPAIVWIRGKPRIAWIVVSALLGAWYVERIFELEGYFAFTIYYQNRSFMVLLLPALVAALLAVWGRRPAWLASRPYDASYWILVVPVAFAVLGDGIGTWRWNQYVDTFCQTLESKASPLERVQRLRHSGVRTGWVWTHPVMSALLRDRGSTAVVANEPGVEWEPFDAAHVPALAYRGLCQAPLLGPSRADSFEIPMTFSKGSYPSYVASVSGMSKPEEWATWTDGPAVEIRFTRPLPASFDLVLRIASAFGRNKELPVVVTAGTQRQTFVAGKDARDVTLHFDGVAGASALSFAVPQPQSPKELGMGDDTRKLGIALVSLRVVPQ